MYAVCVTIHVKAGQSEAFMPLMQLQADNSLKLEPDCHRFDVCSDAVQPEQVFLYELYSDAEAFQVHLKTAHFLQFDEAVSPLIESKTINTFTAVYPA